MLILFKIYRKIIATLSKIGIGRIPGIYRFKPLVNKLYFLICDYLPGKNKPIEVLGSKMYIGSISTSGVSHSLLFNHVYEKMETDLFMNSVNDGMVVVDIGANIGYYSLIAAKLVGNSGKVYAFEPEPDNYRLLVQNIKVNNYGNIVAVQKAVSDSSGKRMLFLSKMAHDHSFTKESAMDTKDGPRRIEIETTSLDEFFKQEIRQVVDLVKIDTEGAEWFILKGMSEIIKANNNLKILMEFWPYGIKSLGLNPLELINFMRNNGFIFKLIDPDKQRIDVINPEHIIKICEGLRHGKGSVNLLLER